VVAPDESEPRPGVDYPGTWHEFLAWFPDDPACLAYLERLRWPKGFVCPKCSCARGWRIADGRWSCGHCKRKVSVTAGTIFDKTRTSLTTWFAAIWYVTNQKHGASALGLQRVLGLGSYQTAWTMLHKLRRAMVRPDRDRLSGVVEVDETYVGGEEVGTYGRETATKSLVAVAAEERGKGIGRIRLRRVENASADSLEPFVTDVVEPGSVVHTDGWGGYVRVKDLGYEHRVSNIRRSGRRAHEEMPRVHRVASLLKRWLLGTHQGAVSPEHLDYYLDEFTFRFNRRRSRRRGLLFYRLLDQAVVTAPAPYRDIVAGRPRRRKTGSPADHKM
jgi:transposase-like protein